MFVPIIIDLIYYIVVWYSYYLFDLILVFYLDVVPQPNSEEGIYDVLPSDVSPTQQHNICDESTTYEIPIQKAKPKQDAIPYAARQDVPDQTLRNEKPILKAIHAAHYQTTPRDEVPSERDKQEAEKHTVREMVPQPGKLQSSRCKSKLQNKPKCKNDFEWVFSQIGMKIGHNIFLMK